MGIVRSNNVYDFNKNWSVEHLTGFNIANGLDEYPIMSGDDELIYHLQFYIEAAADNQDSCLALTKRRGGGYDILWGGLTTPFTDYVKYGLTNSRRYQVIVNTDGICGVDLDFPAPLKWNKDEEYMWVLTSAAAGVIQGMRSVSRGYT